MKTKILAIVLVLISFLTSCTASCKESYSQNYLDTVEVSIEGGKSTYIVDKLLPTDEAKAKFVEDKLHDIIDNSKMIVDLDFGEANPDEINLFVNDKINSDDIKEINAIINLLTIITGPDRTLDFPVTLVLGDVKDPEDYEVLMDLSLSNYNEETNGNKSTYKCDIDGQIYMCTVNKKYAQDLLLKYTYVLCYKILSYDYY